jgi:hypothetical protein
MSGIGVGHDEGDFSWTNEELPLEVRRALLDQALQDLRAARAVDNARAKVPAALDRAGQSGSERDPGGVKVKPKA